MEARPESISSERITTPVMLCYTKYCLQPTQPEKFETNSFSYLHVLASLLTFTITSCSTVSFIKKFKSFQLCTVQFLKYASNKHQNLHQLEIDVEK